MTSLSRTVLATSCAISLGIIGFVHYKQYDDREQLHIGVVRDMERQARAKRENIFALQRQLDLAKELKAAETKNETNLKSEPS